MDKNLGKGIATAGIWIGVALCAFADPFVGFIAAICATIGTFGIWDKD